MVPGIANLRAAANAYDERRLTLPGFTSTSGVAAKAEFRSTVAETSTLHLTLTHVSGLTLTTDGTNLIIDWIITETQMDALRAAVIAANTDRVYWSLKITPANARTQQWFVGTYMPIATPTA
jgi:hypothetical protein